MRPRTCLTCGAAFPGGPRARYCPTCRAERQKTRERKYQASGYSRHLGDIDNCVICGGEYVIRSGLQKYCPKCAPDAVREVDRAQSNRWNAEHDYRAKRRETPRRGVKICVVCGREIVPGTPTVTCSPECTAAHRKEAQLRADAKRRQKGEITMTTDKLFYTLFGDAITSPDRDAFVSDWSLSSVWGDAPDAEIPADRIDLLARLWDAAHLTIRDIRQHTGLSQAAFAMRYCIPTRTLEDWERGVRSCPDYLRLLLAQATGLYVRP